MAMFDYKTCDFLKFLTESHPPSEVTAIFLQTLGYRRSSRWCLEGVALYRGIAEIISPITVEWYTKCLERL